MIADRAPRCTALDTLRGIAVVAMLLNHAGVSLLRPELVAEVWSLGGALTFFGSFAPNMVQSCRYSSQLNGICLSDWLSS